jgi:hypothetical protein
VPWSPPVPLPEWWNRLDAGRPTVAADLARSNGPVAFATLVDREVA